LPAPFSEIQDMVHILWMIGGSTKQINIVNPVRTTTRNKRIKIRKTQNEHTMFANKVWPNFAYVSNCREAVNL